MARKWISNNSDIQLTGSDLVFPASLVAWCYLNVSLAKYLFDSTDTSRSLGIIDPSVSNRTSFWWESTNVWTNQTPTALDGDSVYTLVSYLIDSTDTQLRAQQTEIHSAATVITAAGAPATFYIGSRFTLASEWGG